MRDTTTGQQYENLTSLPAHLLKTGWKQHGDAYKSPCGTFTATFHSKTRLHGTNGLLAQIEAPNRNKVSVKRQPDEAMLLTNAITGGRRIKIIEKKTQRTSGSADEKLGTVIEKQEYYDYLFEGTGITPDYMFLLDEWFEHARYNDYRRHWAKHNHKVMYGTYDNKILGIA